MQLMKRFIIYLILNSSGIYRQELICKIVIVSDWKIIKILMSSLNTELTGIIYPGVVTWLYNIYFLPGWLTSHFMDKLSWTSEDNVCLLWKGGGKYALLRSKLNPNAEDFIKLLIQGENALICQESPSISLLDTRKFGGSWIGSLYLIPLDVAGEDILMGWITAVLVWCSACSRFCIRLFGILVENMIAMHGVWFISQRLSL